MQPSCERHHFAPSSDRPGQRRLTTCSRDHRRQSIGGFMKVSDIMQTGVKTVTGDTPVSEVIVSFEDVQGSGLPVVDSRGRAVGVVSSTDLITTQARARTAQERQL